MKELGSTINQLVKLSQDSEYCENLKNKIQKCNLFHKLSYSNQLKLTINKLLNEKK